MKKLFYFLLANTVAMGVGFAQHADPEAANGGFELFSAGEGQASVAEGVNTRDTTIKEWYMDGGDNTKNAKFTAVTTTPREGTKCFEAQLPTDAESDFSTQTAGKFYCKTGTYYRCNIWARANKAGMDMNFTIGQWNDWVELANLNNYAITTAWQQLSVVVKATRDSLRIPVHFHDAGTYWLDDFTVTKSHLASASVDKSGDTLTLDFGFSLDTIDASFDLTKIKVTSSASTDPIVAVGYKYDNVYQGIRTALKFKLASTITEGATLTVAYEKPTLSTEDRLTYSTYNTHNPDGDADVVSFSGEVVENNVGKVDAVSVQNTASIGVYPNPFVNSVTVSGLENVTKLDVFSMDGKCVKSVAVSGYSMNINMADLNSGVYFMVTTGNNGIKNTLKIVK